MPNYDLTIRKHNLKPHLDIEEEIKKKQNGLFTFTIRINGGNIVDFNVTEYIDIPKKYGIVKAILIEELTVEM